jgi:hypothetical protein
VKNLKYDGERTYDFAHTISQKHMKDLTAKLYNRFLHKFDMKLLTKKPRNGVLPVDGGDICINHQKYDTELKKTYVYCILSTKDYSLYPDETRTTFNALFDNDIIESFVGDIVDDLSHGKFKFISKY